MSRAKYYPPKERQYLFGNALQCVDCGNTKAFSLNLRIPYHLTVTGQGIQSSPDDHRLHRIFESLGKNLWRLIDKDIWKGTRTIQCANCHDGFVDFQERLHDMCFHYNCNGCEVCGRYMSEVDVKEICSECLLENDGEVTEEDCTTMCPWTIDGLGDIRAHHDFTLDDLKQEMGYR